MKRFKFTNLTAFVTAAALTLLATAVFAAGDDRQCTVSYSSTVAGTTAGSNTDGGSSSDGGIVGHCNWGPGTTLLMQCSTSVYYSSSGVATSSDFQVDFASNKDQSIIYQNSAANPVQEDVSVLGVSAAGTCKFAKTNRRKPL